MFQIIIKIVMLFIVSVELSAYDIPKIDVSADKKPKIVFFDAQSVLVKDKLSYTIEWKTLDATDVQLTFIGKVDLSGSMTVTEDEYKRGPITLTASSRDSSFSDSKTINRDKRVEATPIPIIKKSKTSVTSESYYRPMLYPRRTGAYRRQRSY